MSILLVKDLKMDVGKKAFVVIAFGLRLPCISPNNTRLPLLTMLLSMIAATILRLRAAGREVHSDDPTFAGTFFVIWSIVEAHFSICSSNIACLKPFIAAFNTSYGGSAGINELSRRARTTNGHSGSSTIHSLQNFRRKNERPVLSSNNSTNLTRSHLEREAGVRNDRLGNDVDVVHEDTGSVGSGGSRQMIIQKDVTWDVEYSTPKPAKARLGGVHQ